MKPEQNTQAKDTDSNPAPVTGDVIGDTAYSERFVLKILLKLANLDTLKEEINEKSFEDDLCTLWDMTAERDVVLFLQKHDILNLFQFTLPVIESARIIEIVVGIIGNMCCQREAVDVLLKKDSFLKLLIGYMKSDDSLVLIQLLRLVSSCLFVADENDIVTWMNLLENVSYSSTLYFILKNSSSKVLIVTALENLNTLCSCCNIEKTRSSFFSQFVTPEALESLSVAFTEVTITQKDTCQKDELERVLLISLQIVLNLLGFDTSPEIYAASKHHIVAMINAIITYSENKFVGQKEIDSDLVDIIDSTNTIVNILRVSEMSEPEKYFAQSYSMWKALALVTKSNRNGSSNFEEDDKEELQEFSEEMKAPLSTLLCIYMAHCSDDNLLKVLDDVGTDYEEIIGSTKDQELRTLVLQRTVNYRTRLKNNVDS